MGSGRVLDIKNNHMIISALYYFLGGIINIFAAILSVIPLVVPVDFQNSVAYFAGYINYVGGIVNLPTTMGALAFFMNFLVAWFTFKVIMFVFHLIRPNPHKNAPIAAHSK